MSLVDILWQKQFLFASRTLLKGCKIQKVTTREENRVNRQWVATKSSRSAANPAQQLFRKVKNFVCMPMKVPFVWETWHLTDNKVKNFPIISCLR